MSEKLTTESLQKSREWFIKRKHDKPWFEGTGESPRCMVDCDYMIALIDEVVAGRRALEGRD